MLPFRSPALSLTLNDRALVTELTVAGGENLIRELRPFARLEYFEPQPAFTNEWVHPLHIDEPVYVNADAAYPTPTGFALTFGKNAEDVHAEFDVEVKEDALIIVLKNISSHGKLPARVRFAWLALRTDCDTAVTGMAMDSVVEGGTLPGITDEQWAFSYEHTGYEGRRWALTGAKKSDLRVRMQDVLKKYSVGIPVWPTGGPFAADCKKIQGSYLMVYGAYLEGSLTPQNLEEFIPVLHSIGLTQVDFHGAEGKNFTFGDFEPNREIFPEGRKTFKEMVARLHEEGIDSILHTYSALIGDNSSLVKPVPDKDLGYNRLFTLTASVDAQATELPIAEDTAEISLVHTGHYNSSTYVAWDDEIIQFQGLGLHSLKNCIRGALGTTPAPHKSGTKGRNLKRKYNILAPDVGGRLFDHVARETAACANECNCDGFYFDALEGAHVLEGRDYEDYWCTKFVYDVAKYVGRPIEMEMSTIHHNLWFVRSRLGAWDRPSRAHKAYLERHAEVDRLAQERFLIPQNLGWWYFGRNLPAGPSQWERITTDVYDTMGRLAAANDFSLSFQGLTIQDYKASTELQRCGDRVRRWEALRLSGKLTPEQRKALGQGECHMTQDAVYSAAYPETVAQFADGKAEITLENPYGAQKPFLVRLEPLFSRADSAKEQKHDFDVNDMVAADGIETELAAGKHVAQGRPLDGVNAKDLLVFHSRTVTGSAQDEESPYGKALSVTGKAARSLGVIRFERRFEEPLNIAGQYGCGVWVYGDGKGEIVNLQMRCHRLFSDGMDENIIKIDFTGWRYFELIECSSTESMQYLWPYHHRQLDTEQEFAPESYEAETNDWPDSMYLTDHRATGNPHHLTAANADFSRIAFASVWLNNLPVGEEVNVKIAGWHTFYTQNHPVSDITLADAAGNTVQVAGTLPPDSIAEYSDENGTPGLGEAGTAVSSWYTSDSVSVPLTETKASGMIQLDSGKNTLTLKADVADGVRMRVVCGVQSEKPLFCAKDLQ